MTIKVQTIPCDKKSQDDGFKTLKQLKMKAVTCSAYHKLKNTRQ